MNALIKDLLSQILKKLGLSGQANFSLELPPEGIPYDLATNVALILAAESKSNPRELATKIATELNKNKSIDYAEVAGPGFVNIKLSKDVLSSLLNEVLVQKDNYGSNDSGKGKTVCVEYISANPTGQVHIGNARGGPIGESIANLYEFLGYQAVRRFYVNDIGGQVEKLALTFYYWYEKSLGQDIEFPEGGYPGEYIHSVAEAILKNGKAELAGLKDKTEIVEFLKREGLKLTIENIKNEVDLLNIKYDYFDYQSHFELSGKTDDVIAKLDVLKATVSKEGALWFKNPNDPEMAEKEAVLKKSDEDGTLTYFADDVAYHAEKFEQKYEKVIDILGSNHHGHLPRMKAVLNVLGYDVNKFDVILYQFVQLKNGDEIMKMSKRMGNFVTLAQVINGGVTPDAFKFFILSQNFDTPIDFDVKLASERSEKNPVFYVQYAHARISSILRKSKVGDPKLALDKLSLPLEEKIIKNLIMFPDLLLELKETYQIQKLAHYAYKLASLFHEYYANTQILVDDKKVAESRLALIIAVKTVLKNSLSILDIDAPEKM